MSGFGGGRLSFRVSRVLMLGVLSVAALAMGGSAWSAPAAQSFPVELDFRGPFDLYHGVRLHVETIAIIQSGDQWSAGDARFRFRLDVGPCPSVDAEMGNDSTLIKLRGVNEGLGLDDCDYSHQSTLGPLNVYDGDVLDVDRWLPPRTDHVATSQLPVFRYGDDLVRARIGGEELDLTTDEFMGGIMIAQRCGYPGHPDSCPIRVLNFNSCDAGTPPGNLEEWPCYELAGGLVIEPTRHVPDAHLDVTRVLASASRCVEDRDFTFGVHLVNPERAGTDPFWVRVAKLDPESRSIVDTWDSQPHPGLEPDEGNEDPVPVMVRLGSGEHELMIAAMSGRTFEGLGPAIVGRGSYMGTAVELNVTCFPDLTDLPNILVSTPELGPQRDAPGVQVIAPTATSTPEDRPAIDRPLRATATSTTERLVPPIRDLPTPGRG